MTLTNLERATLADLKKEADELSNGHAADASLQSRVLAKIAHVVIAIAESGAITPAELEKAFAHHEKQCPYAPGDWKTVAARTVGITIPLCATGFGLAIAIIKMWR